MSAFLILLAACVDDDASTCNAETTASILLSAPDLATGETLTVTVVPGVGGPAITRVDVDGNAAAEASNVWTASASWDALVARHGGTGVTTLLVDVWPAFCAEPLSVTASVTLEPSCAEPPTGTLTVSDFELGIDDTLTITASATANAGDVVTELSVNGLALTDGALTLDHQALTSLLGGPASDWRPLTLTLSGHTEWCPEATQLASLVVEVQGSGPSVDAPIVLSATSTGQAAWMPLPGSGAPSTTLTVSVDDPAAVGATVTVTPSTGGVAATPFELVLGEHGEGAQATSVLSPDTAGVWSYSASGGSSTASLDVTFVATPTATVSAASIAADGTGVIAFSSVGGSFAACYAAYPTDAVTVYRGTDTAAFTGTDGLSAPGETFYVEAANTADTGVTAWVTCLDAYGRGATGTMMIEAVEATETSEGATETSDTGG